jgi:hypothetical protein
MPVPLYLSGVVIPDMSGSPALIFNPVVSGKYFETASTHCEMRNQVVVIEI